MLTAQKMSRKSCFELKHHVWALEIEPRALHVLYHWAAPSPNSWWANSLTAWESFLWRKRTSAREDNISVECFWTQELCFRRSRSVNTTAAASWNMGPLGRGTTVSWMAEKLTEITSPTWEEMSDPAKSGKVLRWINHLRGRGTKLIATKLSCSPEHHTTLSTECKSAPWLDSQELKPTGN